MQSDKAAKERNDIYSLFQEVIELTGKISSDAYAMRTPLVARDARLLSQGFVRQARVDFLDLRKMVLGCADANAMNENVIGNSHIKGKGVGGGERGGERGANNESRGYTNSSQGKSRIKSGVDERFQR